MIINLLSYLKEVNILDKSVLFQKLLLFTSDVIKTTQNLSKNVKVDDVTPVQYRILEQLAVSEPLTLSQISECQHISMPNTSREIKKLMEKQLCLKQDSPHDRRKQYISLSPEGEAMMKHTFSIVEARFNELIKDIPITDLQQIEAAVDLLQQKVFSIGAQQEIK